MTKMVFVNLPVADLAVSIGFYEALGFVRNEQFSNEEAAVMNWSEAISVNLMTHGAFAGYTPRPVADARQATEVLIALSRDSRAEVDAMAEAAARSGGAADVREPQDLGFMYVRAIEDPDGHMLEPAWMDMSAVAAAS